jgi:hypothetical protein
MVRSSGNINAPNLEADRGLQPSTWTRRLFATRVRFPTPGTGKDMEDEEQDARELSHGCHLKICARAGSGQWLTGLRTAGQALTHVARHVR